MRGIWWDSGGMKGWSSPCGSGCVSEKKTTKIKISACHPGGRGKKKPGELAGSAGGLHQLPTATFCLQDTTAPAFFSACLQAGNGLWKQMMRRQYPEVGGTQLRAERGKTEVILNGGSKLGNDLSSTRAAFIPEARGQSHPCASAPPQGRDPHQHPGMLQLQRGCAFLARPDRGHRVWPLLVLWPFPWLPLPNGWAMRS